MIPNGPTRIRRRRRRAGVRNQAGMYRSTAAPLILPLSVGFAKQIDVTVPDI
jgi:hypothetical protein